jgi:Helix-turn-helix domain
VAIGVMNWVWTHSQSRHGARLVLLAIADCASGDGGNAWPSNKELQRKTNLTERAVRTAVAELIGMGELAVDFNAGPGGCNRYRVIMTPPADPAPGKVCPPAESAPRQSLPPEESGQLSDCTPAKNAPRAKNALGQKMPQGGANFAPVTVLEPSLNSPAESSSSRRKRGTRIPDDFSVTPKMAQWARDNVPELIAQGRGKRETDKFINYWRSKTGRDATKLDWDATWRNWMLNAEDRLGPQAAAAGPGNGSTGTDRAAQALQAGIEAGQILRGGVAS